MGRAKGSLGFVDGRQQVLEVFPQGGRPEFANTFEVALGPVGDHGEFGGDGRRNFRRHARTIDRPTVVRPTNRRQLGLLREGVVGSLAVWPE